MSSVSDDGSGRKRSPYIQSIVRGLAVIRAFRAANSRMTLAEVARATSLSRATARRILLTLEHIGYVRTSDRYFSLTPRVLELGFSYLSSIPFTDAAQPHLQELSRTVGESTSAALLDGRDIVYVARVPVQRLVSLSIDIGTRLPAYATAMGRVLLAGLPDEELDEVLRTSTLLQLTQRTMTDKDALRAEIIRVRHQGWALVDQEALELGLMSIAAPIWCRGKVIAAINISTPARRSAAEIVGEFRDPLLETAQALSRELDSAHA